MPDGLASSYQGGGTCDTAFPHSAWERTAGDARRRHQGVPTRSVGTRMALGASCGRAMDGDAPALDVLAVHLDDLVARLGAEVLQQGPLDADPLRQVLAEHHENPRLPPRNVADRFGQLGAVNLAPVQAWKVPLEEADELLAEDGT